MSRWAFLLTVGSVSLTPAAFSQQLPQPATLPQQPPQQTADLSPMAANETPAPRGLNIVRFDPAQLMLRRIDNRCQVWAGKQLLKDFGPSEREAIEAFRLIRDLRFGQHGSIAGSRPAFEFWLADEEAPRGGFAVKHLVVFNHKTLRVDQVAGAWVVRDDTQLLYNFGSQQEAAQLALAVMKKYGFNQLGYVGAPNPVMTYLTIDGTPHPEQPHKAADTNEMLSRVSQDSLMLPVIGYAGSRAPIEPRKLELARIRGEWVLVHGKDVLARFGSDSGRAREGLRLMQDSRINEICLIGKSSFPIFLNGGQAPRQTGLGFNNVHFNPAHLKVQQVNKVWCITSGVQTLFEFGEGRAEAELVLKVIQHFHFDQVCPIGDLANGGLRILMRTK